MNTDDYTSFRFPARERRGDLELLDKAYTFDPDLGLAPIDAALSKMRFSGLRPGRRRPYGIF